MVEIVVVINFFLMIILIWRQSIISGRLALILEQVVLITATQSKFVPLVRVIAEIKDRVERKER